MPGPLYAGGLGFSKMLDLPTHLVCIAKVNIVGVGFAVNEGERITLPADLAHQFAEKGYVTIIEGVNHVG